MELQASERNGVLVVAAMEPRIDAAGAIRFKDEMRNQLQHPAPRVVLDLSRVTFLDSSGLGAVVAVMKMLGPDRKLELAGLTPPVQKVFRLTRMDGVFTIHASVPEPLRDAG